LPSTRWGAITHLKQLSKVVLEAASQVKRKIILVGDLEKMKPFTQNLPSNIELYHASEAVEMDEKPLDSYRNKKDSSLRVCANLVKEQKAEAMISAGNTGACVATCLLTWRQLQGMHRPAIASIMPNVIGQYLLLDSGASPDVDPDTLWNSLSWTSVCGEGHEQTEPNRPASEHW